MRSLRLALRRLARQPGFSLVAILTLTVGIGATTAIFSIVNGVLLQPLAFPQPQQLVSLDQSVPQFTQKYPSFPVNAYSAYVWQRDSKLLSGIGLMQPDNWVLTGAGQPQQVTGADVTSSMFPTLGIGTQLGRTFLPSEDRPGQNHVVILSDGFWRSEFHTDPSIVGRVIDLNGKPNQVVGVLRAGVHYPHGAELGSFFGATGPDLPMQIFQPLGKDLTQGPKFGNFNYLAFARMKPGVTQARLRAELDGIQAVMMAATHAPAGVRVNTVVTSLRDQIVGQRALGLWLLLVAVGAVLLIVCLNLANLLLVRVHSRSHEIAIRIALGASRARLLRETLLEAVVLALVGGSLGVLAAEAGLRWLVHAAPAGIPRLDEVGIDPVVLVFSFVLALLCGVLFSLWPAWQAARTDPQMALRSGGRSASDSGRRLRGRALLVGGQAALAALLLMVAGLLTMSYWQLLNVNAGFQARQVIEAELDWPGNGNQRSAFYQAAVAKIAALPGVSAAGLIDTIPTQGGSDTDLLSRVHDTRPLVDRPLARYNAVSPGYFAAMGIALERGRTFTDDEIAAPLAAANAAEAARAAKKPVAARDPIAAVVSAATAAKIWPGQNPLGQQFQQSDGSGPICTVVGVAGDVRSDGLDQPPGLEVYLPYTFEIPDNVSVVLRTSTGLSGLAGGIRQAVWSLHPDTAIPTIATMSELVATSVAPRRFQLTLVLLFAVCALLLAALGIYGVIAYTVERRKPEIGLRMVLGAGAGDLIGMVMRQGLTPVVVGLAVGIAAALGTGKVLSSLLFGVQTDNVGVMATVCVLLLVVGALACVVPALRATRVDARVGMGS